MMKTLEQMNALEIRTLASWLRRRLQGRANPAALARLSDEELVRQYLKDNEDKIRHATQKKEAAK